MRPIQITIPQLGIIKKKGFLFAIRIKKKKTSPPTSKQPFFFLSIKKRKLVTNSRFY